MTTEWGEWTAIPCWWHPNFPSKEFSSLPGIPFAVEMQNPFWCLPPHTHHSKRSQRAQGHVGGFGNGSYGQHMIEWEWLNFLQDIRNDSFIPIEKWVLCIPLSQRSQILVTTTASPKPLWLRTLRTLQLLHQIDDTIRSPTCNHKKIEEDFEFIDHLLKVSMDSFISRFPQTRNRIFLSFVATGWTL